MTRLARYNTLLEVLTENCTSIELNALGVYSHLESGTHLNWLLFDQL